MGYYLFCLTLLAVFLPALTAAQCAACDSYKAAVQSCETTSANVTAVGGTMDTTSVHCMCATHNNATNMNTCDGCWNSAPDLKLDAIVLLAWLNTCKADAKFGEQQAVTCWESQPHDYLPCFQKGGAVGGGSAPTLSGVANSPTSSSTATTASTASPGAKSAGVVLLPSLACLALSLVGLGTFVGL